MSTPPPQNLQPSLFQLYTIIRHIINNEHCVKCHFSWTLRMYKVEKRASTQSDTGVKIFKGYMWEKVPGGELETICAYNLKTGL